MGKQKHNVQRPIGAYPSRLRDLWRIITRFRVHVCSTVTRLGRDYHITVHFIHEIGGNFFNATVFECEAIPYLTRADWKSGIVVIGCPHCYSKIFRSIIETSKRGHRIQNKDGGQQQLSNVEFSEWEKNIWPYRVSTHKVQSTTWWLDSCFSSSNEKTLERTGWKTAGRWNSALGRKKPLMS